MFSIAASTQTRYLKFLGITSCFSKSIVRATRALDALTPHHELYRVQHLHTSGTVEHRRPPHRPQPGVPFLSFRLGPPKSSSATSSFSTVFVHNRSSQAIAVGIKHGVVQKPILKEVTENEGIVWMKSWSSWASIIPTLRIQFLSHYSSPLPYDACMHAVSFFGR